MRSSPAGVLTTAGPRHSAGYGATKVLVADDAALAGGLSQPIVDALEAPAREADAVLFGAGVVSADVAAGLAARLGAGIACETTELSRSTAASSPSGRRWATPSWSSRDSAGKPGIVLARANAFAPREEA